MIAYDASYGRQTTALAFIVNRPADEPGFRLDRTDANDRRMVYRHQPYATRQDPVGRRYGNHPGRADNGKGDEGGAAS
jgi:ribulose-bisphosphate carboxylase small chain